MSDADQSARTKRTLFYRAARPSANLVILLRSTNTPERCSWCLSRQAVSSRCHLTRCIAHPARGSAAGPWHRMISMMSLTFFPGAPGNPCTGWRGWGWMRSNQGRIQGLLKSPRIRRMVTAPSFTMLSTTPRRANACAWSAAIRAANPNLRSIMCDPATLGEVRAFSERRK